MLFSVQHNRAMHRVNELLCVLHLSVGVGVKREVVMVYFGLMVFFSWFCSFFCIRSQICRPNRPEVSISISIQVAFSGYYVIARCTVSSSRINTVQLPNVIQLQFSRDHVLEFKYLFRVSVIGFLR